jgi:hypothetical protein
MLRKVSRRTAIVLAVFVVAGAAFVAADRARRDHALGVEQQRLQEMLRAESTAEGLARRLGRPPTQDVSAADIEQITRAFSSMQHRVEEMRTKARDADRVQLYASHEWVYVFYVDKEGMVKDFTCFEQ